MREARTSGRAQQRFCARRALTLGLAGVAVLLLGTLGWGIAASIAGAVIATGEITVESHNQSIEHITTATVSEVLARNGDTVAAGAPLLRLSAAGARSEVQILQARYAELAALRNRLEAELRGGATIRWDTNLMTLAESEDAIQEVLQSQERLFMARAAARAGEAGLLRERIGQAHEEIKGLEARGKAITGQSALIARELDANRKLFEKGLTRLDRLLALERAAKNLEGQAGNTAAAIARTRGRISELELQILQIDTRQIEQAEEQARNAKATENQVLEQLRRAREAVENSVIRAPVAGVVFDMSVTAPGEVVLAGEPILQIVPEGATLIVRARVETTDIDQVYRGQEAVLRLTAFPLHTTPEAAGRVSRISADAVRDADSGRAWYDVELTMHAGQTPGDATSAGRSDAHTGASPGLTPGMPVEVHIQTGERSAISFLAKPIADFFGRSMREQ